MHTRQEDGTGFSNHLRKVSGNEKEQVNLAEICSSKMSS